jgi:hypothetical protein
VAYSIRSTVFTILNEYFSIKFGHMNLEKPLQKRPKAPA